MITKERADEIADQYYRTILDYALYRSKGNYEDALEITQDTFLVFSKKRPELDDDKIKHWLMATARLKACEYYNRKKDHYMVMELQDSFTSADDVLSAITRYHSISDADIRMTIEVIMKMLNEEEHELFIKKFVEQKSLKEIAAELGISPSNASTRVTRLRKKIETLGFLCLSVTGQFIIKNLF